MLNLISILDTESLSLSRRLSIGIGGTIAGMLIVFLALILIAFILGLLKYVNPSYRKRNKDKNTDLVNTAEEIEEVESDSEDEMEIVAAITAAIASTLNTSTDKLIVKSFRRVSNNKVSWNNKNNL